MAFLGLRLELMIYAVSLVLLAFLALAWVGDRDGGPARWIGPGAVMVLLGLAASAWQLAFLVASTLESQRGALAISLGRLLDGELVRWLLASALLQPLLLLMLLNLALAGVCRRATAWSRAPLPVSGLVALLALEGGAAWALDRLGRLLAASLAPGLVRPISSEGSTSPSRRPAWSRWRSPRSRCAVPGPRSASRARSQPPPP